MLGGGANRSVGINGGGSGDSGGGGTAWFTFWTMRSCVRLVTAVLVVLNVTAVTWFRWTAGHGDDAAPHVCDAHPELMRLLQHTTAQLDAAGVNYWLDFATLRAAARDAKLMPWDRAVALGLAEPDCDRLLALRESLLHDANATVYGRGDALPGGGELRAACARVVSGAGAGDFAVDAYWYVAHDMSDAGARLQAGELRPPGPDFVSGALLCGWHGYPSNDALGLGSGDDTDLLAGVHRHAGCRAQTDMFPSQQLTLGTDRGKPHGTAAATVQYRAPHAATTAVLPQLYGGESGWRARPQHFGYRRWMCGAYGWFESPAVFAFALLLLLPMLALNLLALHTQYALAGMRFDATHTNWRTVCRRPALCPPEATLPARVPGALRCCLASGADAQPLRRDSISGPPVAAGPLGALLLVCLGWANNAWALCSGTLSVCVGFVLWHVGGGDDGLSGVVHGCVLHALHRYCCGLCGLARMAHLAVYISAHGVNVKDPDALARAEAAVDADPADTDAHQAHAAVADAAYAADRPIQSMRPGSGGGSGGGGVVDDPIPHAVEADDATVAAATAVAVAIGAGDAQPTSSMDADADAAADAADDGFGSDFASDEFDGARGPARAGPAPRQLN